ncbi:MAG: SMP-30/gluconolactonase/LRE family protein [Gammaproteobacteria bacterium]|nr:SMP-30/gluconolactonase/LRE family protein [Gammaproteobacteria bacterium]
MHYRAETAVESLAFPEGPRWHAGRFWFTDQHERAICSIDHTDQLEVITGTDDLPGGLGWLPDGRLLVVYMTQRRIMSWADGVLELYADLSKQAAFHCNDMVVDGRGRIYVGNFGYDLHGGAARQATRVWLVDVDRRIEPFANDLIFPNGGVITPDEASLLLAETFAHRISEFQLDDNGRMQSRRTWALLGDATPDGICLDRQGALWVASPGTQELFRVQPGGKILARCATRGTPYACMLGGPDRRTLFVCTAETDDPEQARQLASGRIERVEVKVPGAGLP